MRQTHADVVIIGAGIVGITLGLEIKKRNSSLKVLIIEKEVFTGFHASGRNSGVLHAGFYYTADSLKAKFCREGNIEWHNYCEENTLPINKCGKVVVAKDDKYFDMLSELYNRGVNNDVPVQVIDEGELRKIEPRAKTYKNALFSPTTSSIDPKIIMKSVTKLAIEREIEILTEAKIIEPSSKGVVTSVGEIECGIVINASDL